ncbi:phage minor head protein [Maricaulis sp. MIT060901]|uniref:phage minor head protein n=1 Tax=Maricaulis sp. MIT060901 TaxID=3096993 RepID=UPI0039998C7B
MSPPDGAPARDATERYAESLRRRLVGGLRFEGHERRRILALLQEVEDEIVRKIAELDPTGVTQTAAQQRRLRRLLRDARARIRELMRTIRDTAVSGLDEFAAAEAAWAQASMQRAISAAGISLSVRLAPSEVLRTLVGDSLIVGRPLEEWWSRQADGLIDRFQVEMRRGVAQGETLDQLIRRVRGTRANRYADGLMATSRRTAEMAVRTSVNHVGNASRQAVYEANADIITAYVHSSVLDSRTSVTCSARDGKAWDIARKPVGGHKIPFEQPPLHPNCRSVIVPRIGDVTRIPGQRASADGPVPASQTFETWLKAKTVAEQNAILGSGRARVWRQNKLTLSQLLDFKGDPLSLTDLQRRYSA